jgi:hypothetical protein
VLDVQSTAFHQSPTGTKLDTDRWGALAARVRAAGRGRVALTPGSLDFAVSHEPSVLAIAARQAITSPAHQSIAVSEIGTSNLTVSTAGLPIVPEDIAIEKHVSAEPLAAEHLAAKYLSALAVQGLGPTANHAFAVDQSDSVQSNTACDEFQESDQPLSHTNEFAALAGLDDQSPSPQLRSQQRHQQPAARGQFRD